MSPLEFPLRLAFLIRQSCLPTQLSPRQLCRFTPPFFPNNYFLSNFVAHTGTGRHGSEHPCTFWRGDCIEIHRCFWRYVCSYCDSFQLLCRNDCERYHVCQSRNCDHKPANRPKNQHSSKERHFRPDTLPMWNFFFFLMEKIIASGSFKSATTKAPTMAPAPTPAPTVRSILVGAGAETPQWAAKTFSITSHPRGGGAIQPTLRSGPLKFPRTADTVM